MHIGIERHIQTALRGAITPNLGWRLFDFLRGWPEPAAGLRHVQTDQRHVLALAHRSGHCGRGRHRPVRGGRHIGRRRWLGGGGFPLSLARLVNAGLLPVRTRWLPPFCGPRLTRSVVRQWPLPCIAAGQKTGQCQQARGGKRPGHGARHRWARSNGSVTQNLPACSLTVSPRPSCIRRPLRARRKPGASFSSFPLPNPAVVAARPKSCAPNVAAEIQFAVCDSESKRERVPAF